VGRPSGGRASSNGKLARQPEWRDDAWVGGVAGRSPRLAVPADRLAVGDQMWLRTEGPVDGITAQAVLDGIPAATVLLDGRGLIAAVNHSWIEFCVKNGGEVAAVSPPADYIAACAGATPTSTAREVVDGITAVLHGSLDRFDFEYPCHGPDIERWFRMTATPVPHGVLVIHHDISGEYARVSQWLASTATTILELDPQANAVYVNAAWARLARRPARQLLGPHWAEHLDPDQASLLVGAVLAVAESGGDVSLDVRVPDHERQLWIRFAVNPYLDSHGTLRRITLVGIDVTAEHGPGNGEDHDVGAPL
jgi:PAS domain-containing protein